MVEGSRYPMKARCLLLVTAALALLLTSPAKALTHAFIWNSETGMTDLGALAPGRDSFALGINDSGQVVGYGYLSDFTVHGFLWTEATGMVDIGTPGGANCFPTAINSSGAVVGQTSLANGQLVAFYWTSSGGFVTLPQPSASTSAKGINDFGEVTGQRYVSAITEGFIWNPTSGTTRSIGYLAGGDKSAGTDINNLHHATGTAGFPNGANNVFLWKKRSGIQDLGTPLGSFTAVVNAINDQDEIVGFANPGRGFYWSGATGYRILEGLSETVLANGINNSGQIAGHSKLVGSPRFHALLWADSLSTPQDLGTFPDGTDSYAFGINNLGQVVGYGTLSAKVTQR